MPFYSRPVLVLCCASIGFALARRAPRRRLASLAFASASAANATAVSPLALPAPLAALRTPCCIVRRAIVERNCAAMLARAASLGVALRPHVKTHKTVEGALLQTGGRRGRITVSTIAEAEWFAARGFDDILYAVPLTPDKVDEVLALHSRLERFTVMVDHADQVSALLARTELLRTPLRVVLGVDCGYHRDGCDPHDPASVALVRTLCDAAAVRFDGLYTHGGLSLRRGELRRDIHY